MKVIFETQIMTSDTLWEHLFPRLFSYYRYSFYTFEPHPIFKCPSRTYAYQMSFLRLDPCACFSIVFFSSLVCPDSRKFMYFRYSIDILKNDYSHLVFLYSVPER